MDKIDKLGLLDISMVIQGSFPLIWIVIEGTKA
jgi:hypothetical protein